MCELDEKATAPSTQTTRPVPRVRRKNALPNPATKALASIAMRGPAAGGKIIVIHANGERTPG